MNHVSVSPTDGNDPAQGQRKSLIRVGIEPTTLLELSLQAHNYMQKRLKGQFDTK